MSEIEYHVKQSWLDGKLTIGTTQPPPKDVPVAVLLQNPPEPSFRVCSMKKDCENALLFTLPNNERIMYTQHKNEQLATL